MLPLRELQLRFSAALQADIAGPGAAPVVMEPGLVGLVNDHDGLGPVPRIQIYRDMYRSRLVDVLREDFPRVVATLGDEEFEGLVGRYLARHPSTHPSVRYVGARLAEFIRVEGVGPSFLADLARLEWTRLEVFDAADAEPLRLSDLQPLPAAEWPALELQLIPACRVLDCAWPVHRIWAAGAAPGPAQPPSYNPQLVTIRVWREGFDVSHAAIGAVERRLLPLLERGASLSALCAALEDDVPPDAAAREVGGLLMRWLEDEVLVRRPA